MLTGTLMSQDRLGSAPNRRPRGPRPLLTLHHLGFDDEALADLETQLAALADELPVDLVLHADRGDLVLIDERIPRELPAQALMARCAGRPWMEVPREPAVAGMARGTIAAQRLRRMLLDQIDALLRKGRAAEPAGAATAPAEPQSATDADFDSRWPVSSMLTDHTLEEDRRRLLAEIRLARRTARRARLSATYGPDATIVFDFVRGKAFLDLAALQYLRSQRELPIPISVAEPHERAIERDLGRTLWDIGIAAGPFPLIDAPAAWRHTPLVAAGLSHIANYTKMPLHLEMARRLLDSRLTPIQLHRIFRQSARDLRCFMQACLLLGLLRWAAPSVDVRLDLPPPLGN